MVQYTCVTTRHVVQYTCVTTRHVVQYTCVTTRHVVQYTCVTTRHVVQYTCDYWMTYRAAATDVAMVTLERLQTECDMVLLRAVNSILFAQRSAHLHCQSRLVW